MSDVDLEQVLRACEHVRRDLKTWLGWAEREANPDDIEAKVYGPTFKGLASSQAQDEACELAAAAVEWSEDVPALRSLMTHGLRTSAHALAALDTVRAVETRVQIEILRHLRKHPTTVEEAAAQLRALAADRSLDPYKPEWANGAIGVKLLDAIQHGAFDCPPFSEWAARWRGHRESLEPQVTESLMSFISDQGYVLDGPTHSARLRRIAEALDELKRKTELRGELGGQDEDSAALLEPGEAIAMLKLGDSTDAEKRRAFAKLLKIVEEKCKVKGSDGITRVRLPAWREVCATVKGLAKNKEDWSEAADDPAAIERRIATERERKRQG
jgi:hypothetical protein